MLVDWRSNHKTLRIGLDRLQPMRHLCRLSPLSKRTWVLLYLDLNWRVQVEEEAEVN